MPTFHCHDSEAMALSYSAKHFILISMTFFLIVAELQKTISMPKITEQVEIVTKFDTEFGLKALM